MASAFLSARNAKALTPGDVRMYNAGMDVGMQDLVARIFTAVSFIAVGGAVAIVFFFMFAQSILGSKRVQHKLESLDAQLKRTNDLLEEMVRQARTPDRRDEGQ
jgi:hypothetical protein